jgi:hypothetical protein
MVSTRPISACILTCLFWLSFAVGAGAQTPAEKLASRKQQAQKVLEDSLAEIASLRLSENRIALQTKVVSLLWPRDEPRARALAQQTLAQFLELIQQLPAPGESAYYQQANLLRNLSRPLFEMLVAREPKMALDLLQAMRAIQPGGEGDTQPRELELQLIARLAAEDPKLALPYALESLKQGFSYNLLSVWQSLRNKDPQLAEQFLNEIISQLKTADLLTDNSAIQVLTQLVRNLSSEITNAERSTPPAAQAATAKVNLETARQQLRQLLELWIGVALKVNSDNLFDNRYGGTSRYLLVQLQQFLPVIEKQLPARLPAVRAKLAQLGPAVRDQGNPFEAYQPENKSAEELTVLAAKAPAQVRAWLFNAAVNKLVAKGELDQARQLINDKITDPQQRREALANLDRQLISQATQAGKYEEALALASRLSQSEQFYVRLNLAQQALQKEDKKTALRLLAETRAWVGERMETRMQVEQQAALAQAYVRVEAARSFELLEAIITRLNPILAAYATIMPFDENESFKEGEWRLAYGQVNGLPQNFEEALKQLGQQDFGRAANLLKLWEAPEVRLLLQFTLVEAGLADDPVAQTGEHTGQAGGQIRAVSH